MITRIALNLKEKKRIDTNYRLYRMQNLRITEYFGKCLFHSQKIMFQTKVIRFKVIECAVIFISILDHCEDHLKITSNFLNRNYHLLHIIFL